MGADVVLDSLPSEDPSRELGRVAGAAEVAGLDALETGALPRVPLARRVWAATWPKLLAIAIVLALWQAVVLARVWPSYALPGPADVLAAPGKDLQTANLWNAIFTTLRRGAWGFALAVVIGVAIGALVARFAILRAAIGSLVTGLQTMPS